jgi:hypothetical protein
MTPAEPGSHPGYGPLTVRCTGGKLSWLSHRRALFILVGVMRPGGRRTWSRCSFRVLSPRTKCLLRHRDSDSRVANSVRPAPRLSLSLSLSLLYSRFHVNSRSFSPVTLPGPSLPGNGTSLLRRPTLLPDTTSPRQALEANQNLDIGRQPHTLIV